MVLVVMNVPRITTHIRLIETFIRVLIVITYRVYLIKNLSYHFVRSITWNKRVLSARNAMILILLVKIEISVTLVVNLIIV